MTPASHPKRPAFADILAILVLLASLGALGLFFAIDRRPPPDLGHYYILLPDAWKALQRGSHPGDLVSILVQVGGLYNVVLATLLHMTGRSPTTMEALECLWLGLLLGGGWWAARNLVPSDRSDLAHRSLIGCLALGLAAALPVFQYGVRSHWIHAPEAGILALALALWLADRPLDRRVTRLGLFLCLAFALTLRPTGLLFGGSLLLAILWDLPRRRRILWPAAALVPGLGVALPDLPDYIGGKLGVREVYVTTVDPLLPSLREQAFLAPGLLILTGMALTLLRGRRPQAPTLLLLSWLLGSLLLCVLFHVGPDNFPLLFLAGTLLAAPGLAALARSPWIAGLLGLSTTVLSLGTLAMPFAPPPMVEPFLPLLDRVALSREYRFWLRPLDDVPTMVGVLPVLEGVCSRPEGCSLVATRGIFNLNREDNGALALFLEGVDRIAIYNASQWFPFGMTATGIVDGILVLECPGADPEPESLYTRREAALAAIPTELEVSKAGRFPGPSRCDFQVWRIDEADSAAAILAFWQDWERQARIRASGQKPP